MGKDVMLGTGNDWCENLSTISQSKYVTSSSQSYTNTVKRKAETMTNHTNTAILPIKRNKLDLKVRIQQINAQELTSTNTVGQFQTIDPPLNTASICNDILDMQAPPEFPVYYTNTYSPATESCQEYQFTYSPVPEPSQTIDLPHSPDSSSILSDFKQEEPYQFSATNSPPSTEFSAPASPASSYPFSPSASTNTSSPNSSNNTNKRRRGRPSKVISTEPDEAELSKCKTKAERDHYLRRFRNNEASRKSRLLNKQRTEQVEKDIRHFEQENLSLEQAVESDKIKIKMLKEYINNKLTTNMQKSYSVVH
uniref:BZIP domain-containing protein n=1 Tax=Megaselia scalaris TaxID=36166 RepID=T1GD65_MEGSC